MRRKIIVELLGIPLFIIPIPFHYHYSPIGMQSLIGILFKRHSHAKLSTQFSLFSHKFFFKQSQIKFRFRLNKFLRQHSSRSGRIWRQDIELTWEPKQVAHFWKPFAQPSSPFCLRLRTLEKRYQRNDDKTEAVTVASPSTSFSATVNCISDNCRPKQKERRKVKEKQQKIKV